MGEQEVDQRRSQRVRVVSKQKAEKGSEVEETDGGF